MRTGGRELGQGTGELAGRKLGAANWGQRTWDRELGTGNGRVQHLAQAPFPWAHAKLGHILFERRLYDNLVRFLALDSELSDDGLFLCRSRRYVCRGCTSHLRLVKETRTKQQHRNKNPKTTTKPATKAQRQLCKNKCWDPNQVKDRRMFMSFATHLPFASQYAICENEVERGSELTDRTSQNTC